MTTTEHYDFLIVGSGIAGLYAALIARHHGTVAILTKGAIDDTNTKYAQGGIAAALGPDDDPELHLRDTITAGAGLVDEHAARILVEAAPDRIADLVTFGVPFDATDGEVALGKEAAHSRNRILHAGGDKTGAHIEISLGSVARMSNITILEHTLVDDILIENGKAVGVKAITVGGESRTSAEPEVQAALGSPSTQSLVPSTFTASAVILATGGVGQLFRTTTNPDVATGDGIALAYRAGADITDMEFIQFHPTALTIPGVPIFLISEAVRGEGAILLNAAGQRFMPNYHPDAELAPRDIVARAIVEEMRLAAASSGGTASTRQAGASSAGPLAPPDAATSEGATSSGATAPLGEGRGGVPGTAVYLDVRHLPPERIAARFPQIYKYCLDHGLDITREPVPVSPAAHYMMGGVRTNTWGETTIPHLYACGECACTGVHGANRLASNSLLETVVFAKRIVERVVASSRGALAPPDAPSEKDAALPDVVMDLTPDTNTEPTTPPTKEALQALMWDNVGIVRNAEGLAKAVSQLKSWSDGRSFATAKLQAAPGGLVPGPQSLVPSRAQHELANMITVGRMMAEAALAREESRGAHYRTDFPDPRDQWRRHIVFRRNND